MEQERRKISKRKQDRLIMDYYLKQIHDEDAQAYCSNLANVNHFASLLLHWVGAGTPIFDSIEAIRSERILDKQSDHINKFMEDVFSFAVLDDLYRTCDRMEYMISFSVRETIRLAKEWRRTSPEAYAPIWNDVSY